MNNEVRRRISLIPEANLPHPNSLFEIMQDAFNSIIDIPQKNSDVVQIGEIYTTSRLTDTQGGIFLYPLPTPLNELPREEIGPLEAELISFLLNCPTNKMLTVVGDIGIGKSTFLRYILFHLREKYDVLKSFLPIYLDLLEPATKDPSELDILFLLINALKLMPECQWFLPKLTQIENKIDQYNPDTARIQILQLMGEISDHFKGNNDLFLFIDNNDHLSPQASSMIFDIGRACFLQHSVGVIVAVRPHTYKTRLESGEGKGAFLFFRLFVTPPDLRFVIRKRMKILTIGKNEKIKIPSQKSFKVGTFTISLQNIKDSIEKLIDYLLNSQAQTILCASLFNNSIRLSLVALDVFLRYKDLDLFKLIPELVPRNPDDMANINKREPTLARYDLLNGVMRGDYLFYREDRFKLIPNLYIFETDSGTQNYLIQFHVLSLLHSLDSMILSREVLEILKVFKHSREDSLEAIKKLIKYRLIISPETDDDLSYPQNIRISPSGKYYIDTLISDQDYLFNIIFDVPLPHARWQTSDDDNFSCRLNSMEELLKILVEQERNLTEVFRAKWNFHKNKKNQQSLSELDYLTKGLSCLMKMGFLSQHLLTGMKKNLRNSKRNLPLHVKEDIEKIEESIWEWDSEIRVLGDDLLFLIGQDHTSLEDKGIIKNKKLQISKNAELEVIWPDQTSARTKDKLEVHLRGKNINSAGIPLFASCKFAEEKTKINTPIIRLSPINSKELYGNFILDTDLKTTTLGPFEIEILSGENLLGSVFVSP
ncbi:MAG: hypothetical protein R3B95_00420 [Nitrospirales bacterium]|nr:hypothetical protein [Nitrospirales bacterium]